MELKKTLIQPALKSGRESLKPARQRPGLDMEIVDETTLLAAGKALRAAMHSHPDFAGLLFINPVMLLLDLGFTLSPAMQHHISHFLGSGEDTPGELDALEQELNEAIGRPRALTYSNPKHVARIVFEILGIRPRATAGIVPPMKTAEQIVPMSRTKVGTRSANRSKVRRNTRHKSVRRGASVRPHQSQRGLDVIDFDAELPQLPFVDVAPDELPLEELMFYRDEHPLIPKLCRYQTLWRRRLAFATPEPYGPVHDGEPGAVWRSWIDNANFPRRRD
jgi:hypothetical protein